MSWKTAVAIPIIIGGVLYWICRDTTPSDEKLAEEKRELRKRMKQISKEQQQRARLKEEKNRETVPT